MNDYDPDALRQAISELRDFNKEKRRTAVMKLGMMGGEEAVRTLINVVRNSHEDLIVRGRAALMLGKLKDPRAVDPLIEALDSQGYQMRLHAAEALGKLGDPRAIDALRRIVESDTDSGGKVQSAAHEALQRLGCSDESSNSIKPELEPSP